MFVITALYDLFWQQMAKGNIYICFDKEHKILCPSEWKWVETGKNYFKHHSTLGAMAIAGICGLYALFVYNLLRPFFGGVYDLSYMNIFNIFFSSWLVGIPMRYSPDPFHKYLFSTLRKHYYEPLGFWWSSYTDAQSGLLVVFTYFILLRFCPFGEVGQFM